MSSNNRYQHLINSHLIRAEEHLQNASKVVKKNESGMSVIVSNEDVVSFINRALFHVKNAKIVIDTIEPSGGGK